MNPSALDACRKDLYTAEAELKKLYPADTVKKILRVRAMHQYLLANPGSRDSTLIREDTGRHGISRTVAYTDLHILKALLPHISQATKEFHTWRYTEMILQTFEMARLRSDVRTMERAASSYAKYTKIDQEQKTDIPIDQVLPQPFIATDDPSVLGIKPIPNLRRRQRMLLEKYTKETADIQDISYEPIDLQEDDLFSPIQPDSGQDTPAIKLPTAAQLERHAQSDIPIIDDA